MTKRTRMSTLAVVAGLAVVTPSAEGLAGGMICENLDNTLVIVGESRYNVDSGLDSCFANAYYDNAGDELFLNWKTIAGRLTGPTAVLRGIGIVNSFVDDVTDDAANVTFLNSLQSDDTELAGAEPNCIAGIYNTYTPNLVINSASAGGLCTDPDTNRCKVYITAVRGAFSVTFDPDGAGAEGMQKWWLARVDVDDAAGGECFGTLDLGCTKIEYECPGGTEDLDSSFP